MADSTSFLLKMNEATDLREQIDFAKSLSFDGIITPVIDSLYSREFIDKKIGKNQKCFTRSPLILYSSEWNENVSALLTLPNITVEDEEMRENNELQFRQELQFALHIKSRGNIVLQMKNFRDPAAFGKFLINLPENFHGKILLSIPMVDPKKFSSVWKGASDDFEGIDMWTVWHKFHAATNFNLKIEVALTLPNDLPSAEELKRWLGEPVSMLIIPYSCFTTSGSNYAILPPQHKKVVAMFAQYCVPNITIAIEPKSPSVKNLIKNYREFILHIYKSMVARNSVRSLADCIQYPLQPLHDNLETETYEAFEKDPAKYILYQRAIENAIIDKTLNLDASKALVLMVLGAGRGPLVRAALNASKNTKKKLKILVVEKNPNAIVTLTCMIDMLWKNEDITLISDDMRTVKLEEKADIIVSELLGSFGDNELSPECLDGAQKLLKPDGISIPCDSVAYLRPVMANRVYTDALGVYNKSSGQSAFHMRPLEVNWLSHLSSVYFIDETKKLWEFVHPNLEAVIDNNRNEKLTFTAKIDCLLHGYSGYFTSKLYKDISISIHPDSHTQGMASWFPMFFPLQNPLYVKAGDKFNIEFWRKVSPDKIWYEWKSHDGLVSNQDGVVHPIFL